MHDTEKYGEVTLLETLPTRNNGSSFDGTAGRSDFGWHHGSMNGGKDIGGLCRIRMGTGLECWVRAIDVLGEHVFPM